MRNLIVIISVLILSQVACRRDDNGPDYLSLLYGKWGFYKSIHMTVINDSVNYDTTYYSNSFLQFDTTEFCKMLFIRNDSTIESYSYVWGFIEPDTIFIASCPEEVICEYEWAYFYKIEELNNYSLILKTHLDLFEETHGKVGDAFWIEYYNRVYY